MEIPVQFRGRLVYHFTHIDNLPEVIEHGLLSTNEKARLGIQHTAVALGNIQDRRSRMDVPCGMGGVVHDYVPFYFCKRSSMLLYIVNNKLADQQFIVYLVMPIKIMLEYPSAFTDAAANTTMPPRFFCDPSDLVQLDWKSIDSLKWSMPSEQLKQARMAELLIHRKVKAESFTRIVVWNESIKKTVENIYKEYGLESPPIGFDYTHYFTNFYGSNTNSIVTGPFFTKRACDDAISRVKEAIGQNPSATYENLFKLRDALCGNLSCLLETAELIELQPAEANIHKEDVGTHTLRVLETLRQLTEYKNLDKTDRLLVELAALLHDIGKGPKSRWASKGGRQQVDPDHPLRALPMLQRILTEEVATMRKRSGGILCKLVCYHDLIGDIIGKGRSINELKEVVDNEQELEMLIAIAKADTIATGFFMLDESKIQRIRKAIGEHFSHKEA